MFHEAFEEEYSNLDVNVQDAILRRIQILEKHGPQAGRPAVDTLKDSKHSNMKELRLKGEYGVWRIAFAFDPKRDAVLLVAGDKSGVSERRFYKTLIKKADERLDHYLKGLKNGKDR